MRTLKAAHAVEEFEAIIRANENDLLRYFQRRTPDGADAGEAFGELMLLAWKARRKMPSDPVQARMWLYTAARNIVRDTHRSLARRSSAVLRLVDDMRVSAPEWDESSLDVRDAIDRLAQDDAELVRLVYWDGLRSHEAAIVLGINASTARSRLSRAKRQLRIALSAETATT